MNEQECRELAAEVEKVLPETFRVSAITPHLTKNNETGEWEPDETKPWNFGIFPLGLLSDCLLVINSRSDWELIQDLADGIVTGKSLTGMIY